MDDLRAEAISKLFPGGSRVLERVSFTARAGHVLTLLGPSGCGKTTLLRIVAGLDSATDGRLFLGAERLDALPPGQRDVGFVFQNYALYPHLTVEGNLSLALRVRRLPAQELLREGMRAELKLLFRRLEATVLYVTHDQAEALSLSDEVLVLKDGRVRQCAPPMEVYARPADLFTATFVGSPRMSVWHGECRDGLLQARGVALAVPDGLRGRARLCMGARAEDVEVASSPSAGAWEARVELVEPTGDRLLLTLRVGQETLRALVPPRELGQRVWARVAPGRAHWFDEESELRLDS